MMLRNFKFIVFLILIILLEANSLLFAQNKNENDDILKVIKRYENALNKENLEEVSKLFSKNAVLVLQGSPTCIGEQSISNFYQQIFNIIDFNIEFVIKEVAIMSSEWAFVRTVTRVIGANEDSEDGHEIFLLFKDKEMNWEIARYAGSSAK